MGLCGLSRYRYISTQLGAPFAKIAELPLTGVSWQRLRNGAGTFQGAVKLPPPITDEARVRCALYRQATDQDTTCVYVLRDNVPVGAYAIGTQTYSSENQQISVNGAELSSYFRRRIIEDLSGDLDLRVSFEGQPMYDAVAAMVGRINDIGLTLDVTPGGPALPVTVPAQENGTPEVAGTGWKGTDAKLVGEAIDELAAMDDGFDYRTDLTREGSMFARSFVLRPTLGEQVGMIAKYAATLSGFTVRRRTRTNDAIAIGGSDGDKRPYGRATDITFTPPLTTVAQLNDEADTDRLDASAQAALDASRSGEVVEFEVIEDGVDAQIGALFPGDNCRIVIPKHKDPWYVNGLDTVVQTLGFTVKVPDSGGRETISLQIDEGDIDG